MASDRRYAVLIDADNVSDKYIKFILDEISTEGIVTIKRIYGDWTKPALSSWKNVLLSHSITPIQQYGYTTGKNATDAAMIIDAMDILYAGNVEGFCLASSDSDFTRLASRVREAGMNVIGMGERKTPKAFIAACNSFKYLEVLAQSDEPQDNGVIHDDDAELLSRDAVMQEILTIVREISDDEGWAPLSDIGNILNKRHPSFDVRTYRYSKLSSFVKSLGIFETNFIKSKDSNVGVVYVREKNR